MTSWITGFLEYVTVLIQSGNSSDFMKRVSSSPYLQETAIIPYPKSDQSGPALPYIFLRNHLIFPCMSTPSKQSCLRFPHQILHAPILSSIRVACLSRPTLLHHPSNVWRGVETMKLLIMQSPQVFSYIFPLRPSQISQHPVLKHPHPTFLSECQRTRFTQNNKKNCISVDFILCISGW